ncbi:hypothetical protein CF326_g9502 [Tilletia indica]|nr:hypothetical protein CF326_g9502 [Tilletia indica]
MPSSTTADFTSSTPFLALWPEPEDPLRRASVTFDARGMIRSVTAADFHYHQYSAAKFDVLFGATSGCFLVACRSEGSGLRLNDSALVSQPRYSSSCSNRRHAQPCSASRHSRFAIDLLFFCRRFFVLILSLDTFFLASNGQSNNLGTDFGTAINMPLAFRFFCIRPTGNFFLLIIIVTAACCCCVRHFIVVDLFIGHDHDGVLLSACITILCAATFCAESISSIFFRSTNRPFGLIIILDFDIDFGIGLDIDDGRVDPLQLPFRRNFALRLDLNTGIGFH